MKTRPVRRLSDIKQENPLKLIHDHFFSKRFEFVWALISLIIGLLIVALAMAIMSGKPQSYVFLWFAALFFGSGALSVYKGLTASSSALRRLWATEEGQQLLEIYLANRPLFQAGGNTTPSGITHLLFGGEARRYEDYYTEMCALLELAYISAGLVADEGAQAEALILQARQLRERRVADLALRAGVTKEEYERSIAELEGELHAR